MKDNKIKTEKSWNTWNNLERYLKAEIRIQLTFGCRSLYNVVFWLRHFWNAFTWTSFWVSWVSEFWGNDGIAKWLEIFFN